MGRALFLADRAREAGDVPVGAVVIDSLGHIIGQGWNRREVDHDPSAHAEIVAMREAGRRLGRWNLLGCTLVVTLEPCTMCAGAAVQARLDRVAFGAWDPKAGAAGSVRDVLRDSRLNHQVEVIGGVLEEEATIQLRSFFGERRAAAVSGDRTSHPATPQPSTTSAPAPSAASAAAPQMRTVGPVPARSERRSWERTPPSAPPTSQISIPTMPTALTRRRPAAEQAGELDSPLFARTSRQWRAAHPEPNTAQTAPALTPKIDEHPEPSSAAPEPRRYGTPGFKVPGPAAAVSSLPARDAGQVVPGVTVRRRHQGGARH